MTYCIDTDKHWKAIIIAKNGCMIECKQSIIVNFVHFLFWIPSWLSHNIVYILAPKINSVCAWYKYDMFNLAW